ncbi:MAG: addiction module protein [Chloroflexi bacterium]|nr:addiction module protein [Chloroflexota bacterium]
MSASEILDQIRRLPLQEQREVAEQILDECSAFDDELSPAQLAELERRAENLRKNPKAGIPWEQVRAELKGRLKQNRSCAGR